MIIQGLIYLLVVILVGVVHYKDGKKKGYKQGHKNGYALGVSDTEECVCAELNEAYSAGIQKGKQMAQQVNLVVERKYQTDKKVVKKKVVKKNK